MLNFNLLAQTKTNSPKTKPVVKINSPAPKSIVTTTVDNKTKTIQIIHAASISYNAFKSNAKVLTGDVICEHDGATLKCDTAYIFDEDKKMEASGHILINKGDSITVTGQKLFYDGKTKIATLQNSVTCVEKDMKLTTNLLTFDVANSVANYYDGGTIVNKENTLKSKNGHYYSATKELAFHYDVELINPDYTMRSDTLRYNTTNKTAYFLGPSIIQSKTDYIYAENGWYDTDKEKAQFSKNAVLVTKDQKLRGDSLFYDRNKQFGKAFKNVTLIDTAQKSILWGDYVEYKQKKSEALVTKRAMYGRILETDTLFIAADTLYHSDIDSTNNFLNAYHHVKIFKPDFQAMADSATFNSKDSIMQLHKAPILWSNQSQATAKTIKVFISNNKVNGFKLDGNSFLIQLVDSLDSVPKYNQLSGKSIRAFIVDDTVKKAVITGNANVYYYPKNKNKVAGLNKTECNEITLWFSKGDIERASTKPKTTGNVSPIADVDIANQKLKGFNWLYHKRPKSILDLHKKEVIITENAPNKNRLNK